MESSRSTSAGLHQENNNNHPGARCVVSSALPDHQAEQGDHQDTDRLRRVGPSEWCVAEQPDPRGTKASERPLQDTRPVLTKARRSRVRHHRNVLASRPEGGRPEIPALLVESKCGPGTRHLRVQSCCLRCKCIAVLGSAHRTGARTPPPTRST